MDGERVVNRTRLVTFYFGKLPVGFGFELLFVYVKKNLFGFFGCLSDKHLGNHGLQNLRLLDAFGLLFRQSHHLWKTYLQKAQKRLQLPMAFFFSTFLKELLSYLLIRPGFSENILKHSKSPSERFPF